MNSVDVADEVCACCGKASVDNIRLKNCACNIVKYCSVDCQKNHRKQHKKACKKRLAEIRDDKLFQQPEESYLGECPLCCLPNSLNPEKSTLMPCCSNVICNGCRYANEKRELEQGLEHKCPFCREQVARSLEEVQKRLMKRAKANDPVTICGLGKERHREGDYEGAFQYYTKAAALGDIESHYELAFAYRVGRGVEKDMKKSVYHLEEAAIGGHHLARFNLGVYEKDSGRHRLAAKHYIIAAKLGYDDALDKVKQGFMAGLVSKEDYASTLRGHQAAVDETKSEQRDAAAKVRVKFGYRV
jgi:tetratricopeptide (TPR) repeat protein